MSASLSSRIATETIPLTGSDGQHNGSTLGKFQIKPGMSVDELKSDLSVLQSSCQEARARDVAHEVSKLAVRTKSRLQASGEAAFLAEVMTDDLAAYPIDVVRFACAYWIEGGKDNKFFPSWPELKEICDRRMSGRLRLARALSWLINEAQEGRYQ